MVADPVCACGHLKSVHDDGFERGGLTSCHDPGEFGGGCGCVGFTETIRCDFCSAIPATWRYPTRDVFIDITERPNGSKHFSGGGGWAACDDCGGLIERRLKTLLAQRCMQMLGYSRALRREKLPSSLSFQEQAFWTQRYGEREPITLPAGPPIPVDNEASRWATR